MYLYFDAIILLTRISTVVCKCASVRVRLHACICACVVCACVYVRVYMYVYGMCVWVFVCVCMRVCMYYMCTVKPFNQDPGKEGHLHNPHI